MTTVDHRPASPAPDDPPRRRRLVRAGLVVLLIIAVLIAGVTAYRAIRTAPGTATLAVVTPVSGAPDVPPEGSWSVAAGSTVGYRVTEPPAVTVVGRTEAVQGTLDVEVSGAALTLTAGTVQADLGELRSDASARDAALRGRILETDQFPDAVFVLQGPVDVGSAEPGVPTPVQVRGVLTIRERTAPVAADLTIRWDGAELRVVGTADISLADYAVEVVQVAGVDSIDDAAQIEIDLVVEPPA